MDQTPSKTCDPPLDEARLERRRVRLYNLLYLMIQQEAPMWANLLNHQILASVRRLTSEDLDKIDTLLRVYLEPCE